MLKLRLIIEVFLSPPALLTYFPILYLVVSSLYYRVEITITEWLLWAAFFFSLWFIRLYVGLSLENYIIARFERVSDEKLAKGETIFCGIVLAIVSLITSILEKMELKIIPWEYTLISGFISPLMYSIGRLKSNNQLRFYSIFIFVLWLISIFLLHMVTIFSPPAVAMKLTPMPFALAITCTYAIGLFYEILRLPLRIMYGLESIEIHIRSSLETRYGITLSDLQELKERIFSSDVKYKFSELHGHKHVELSLSIQGKYVNALFALEDWVWKRVDKRISITIIKPGFYSPNFVSFNTERFPNTLYKLYEELAICLTRKEFFQHILKNEKERNVYELSNGRNKEGIAGELNVTTEEITFLWDKWYRMGIVTYDWYTRRCKKRFRLRN